MFRFSKGLSDTFAIAGDTDKWWHGGINKPSPFPTQHTNSHNSHVRLSSHTILTLGILWSLIGLRCRGRHEPGLCTRRVHLVYSANPSDINPPSSVTLKPGDNIWITFSLSALQSWIQNSTGCEVLPTFNYPPNKVTNPRPQGRGTLLTQFVPGVHFRRCFGDCEWKPSRAPTSGDCDDEPPRNLPLRRVSQSVGGVTQFVTVVGGCYWGKENPAQRLLGNGCTSSVLLKFPLLRWVDLRRSNCQVVVVLSAQTSNILNRLFLLIILKSTWF